VAFAFIKRFLVDICRNMVNEKAVWQTHPACSLLSYAVHLRDSEKPVGLKRLN
jgi:hypothetical protein